MNERPGKKNIRLPIDDFGEDECHFCGDDNTAIVIRGTKASHCGYCGNEIVMCNFCFSVLMKKGDKLINNGVLE